MKKTILLVTLLTLVGTLSSCGNETNSSESSSERSSISDSSIEPSSESDSSSESSSSSSSLTSKWTNEQKALMEEYCGSVLPYPECFATKSVSVQEQVDSSINQKCLVISSKASSFTLETYYEDLEESGWSTIVSYNGDKVQTRSNTQYVELTKNSDDGKVGYEMMYYFVSSTFFSYNCIVCYNYYSSSAREDVTWNDEDNKVIDYVTTTTLPYISLGETYNITAVSENQLYIYDYYTEDLSKKYKDILISNGYVLNEEESKNYNAYFLTKTFENGIKIDILMQYFSGNNFYVYFTPKITEYSSWPSEVTKPIEDRSGISIPEFSIKEGGKYQTYVKHGVNYIYTEDYDDEFNYYAYIDKTRSELFCWEETLSFSAYILRDDDENNTGFVIYFSETTPTRTFVSSWPESGIEEGIKNSLNVTDVKLPSIDLASLSLSKDMKYEIKTQKDYDSCYNYYLQVLTAQYGDTYSEEQIASLAKDYADSEISIGVTLFAYDLKCDTQTDYVTRYKVNEAYKEALYNAGWYKVPESWGNIFEDPTGQIKVTVTNTPSSDIALTKISITKGSGEAHEPTFKFAKDSYEVGPEGKVKLVLETNMVPYEISYSSSDSEGNINVDSNGLVTTSSNVKDGDSATITASYTDKDGVKHSTTCTINIVDKWTYKKSLDEVQALLTNKGYSDFTREDLVNVSKKVIGEKLTIDLGNSITKEEAKSMVKDELIPDEFHSSLWEKVYDDSDDEDDEEEEDSLISNFDNGFVKMARSSNLKDSTVLYSNSTNSDLEKLYSYYRTDYGYFTLNYYVYTAEGGNIILYVEAC